MSYPSDRDEETFSASSGRSFGDDTVDNTGGQEYNSSYNSQQPRGGYGTQQVPSRAEVDNEYGGGQGFGANAPQHVQDSSRVRNEQLPGDENSSAKYGSTVTSTLSSASSNSGVDIGSLASSALGGGGGNQLMGQVVKEAGNAFFGGSGGDKQSFMNDAVTTAAKAVEQGQLSSLTGGSNSGGLGGMLGVGETLLKSRFG